MTLPGSHPFGCLMSASIASWTSSAARLSDENPRPVGGRPCHFISDASGELLPPEISYFPPPYSLPHSTRRASSVVARRVIVSSSSAGQARRGSPARRPSAGRDAAVGDPSGLRLDDARPLAQVLSSRPRCG